MLIFFQLIVKFLSMPDFEDLRRYYLTGDDWEALQAFYDILSVRFVTSFPILSYQLYFILADSSCISATSIS